jgi:hypothetical protein
MQTPDPTSQVLSASAPANLLEAARALQIFYLPRKQVSIALGNVLGYCNILTLGRLEDMSRTGELSPKLGSDQLMRGHGTLNSDELTRQIKTLLQYYGLSFSS